MKSWRLPLLYGSLLALVFIVANEAMRANLITQVGLIVVDVTAVSVVGLIYAFTGKEETN